MGVNKLITLIKKEAPSAITAITIDELGGQRVGIDISIDIYRWYSVGESRGIRNSAGENINHLQGIFYYTVHLLCAGVIPVYIFDGAPPVLKKHTMDKRRLARGDGNAVKLPRGIYEDIKTVIGLLGVTVVQAPAEAEAEAVNLVAKGLLDFIATNDSDALAFGAPRVIRGLDVSGKSITVVSNGELLTKLGLTRGQFIDLCIILGTDYNDPIPNMTPSTALKLIKHYKTIEKIIKRKSPVVPARFDYVGVRKEFLSPKVNSAAYVNQPRQLIAGDIILLKKYLIGRGLLESRLKKTFEKLMDYYGIN